MSDFERVNGPRAEKALKFVRHIQKSAKSYRVSDDELNQILEPLRGALAIECSQTDALSSGKSGGDIVDSTTSAPASADLVEMSWVMWALEHLIYGDTESAIEMLKNGLKGEKP